MNKKWFLILCSVSIFFKAYSQENSNLVDLVCKDALGLYYGGSTYPYIIGETNHPSCSGGSKNAWLMKTLESGDTICSVPHSDDLKRLLLKYYTVKKTGWSDNCPVLGEFGIRVATNTVTLNLKEWPNETEFCFEPLYSTINNPPLGYVSVAKSLCDNKKIAQTIKVAGDSEIVCENSIPSGYVRVLPSEPAYLFTEQCNAVFNPYYRTHNSIMIKKPNGVFEKKIQTYNGHLKNYLITNIHDVDYIQNMASYKDLWIINSIVKSTWLDIKKPIENLEIACKANYLMPLGYRIVAETTSVNCPSRLKINAWVYKKMQDKQEAICMPEGVIGQSIPSNYILIDVTYSPDCPWRGINRTTHLPIANVQQLTRLNEVDEICKSSRRPVGYGIVGETTLPECSAQQDNAWQIQRLSSPMNICKEGGYIEDGRDGFNGYSSYIVTSETFVSGCPKHGNNALTIQKINESNNIICAGFTIPSGYKQEKNIIKEGCPNQRGVLLELQ